MKSKIIVAAAATVFFLSACDKPTTNTESSAALAQQQQLLEKMQRDKENMKKQLDEVNAASASHKAEVVDWNKSLNLKK